MADRQLPIRVLPMSSNEPEFQGKTAQEIQAEFFLGTLRTSEEPGKYYYHSSGLDADPGTVVLFQYEGQIIASAVLIGIERFDETEEGYRGAFQFDVGSIRVFDPVNAARMKKIWPTDFKKFSHAKPSLDPAAYSRFERQLTGIQLTPEPISEASDLAAPPADRVQTMVTRIVRDTRLTNRVKRLHQYECQLCGHAVALANGELYAEGHHIQPLGAPHNGPDAIANIVCLCPNHHAACDFGALRLDMAQLRRVAGHHVSRKYIDYHNQAICRI